MAQRIAVAHSGSIVPLLPLVGIPIPRATAAALIITTACVLAFTGVLPVKADPSPAPLQLRHDPEETSSPVNGPSQNAFSSISLHSPIGLYPIIVCPLPRLIVLPPSTATSTPPGTFESASKLAALIESGFRIAALILGGLFAYWKFFRGRTFHPRLEPSISAIARIEANEALLRISCKLKNVGLSSVDLDQRKSAVRVFLGTLSTPVKKVKEVIWAKTSDFTADVFKRHQWIEGGETIEDAHLFRFPYVPNQVCRVELRILKMHRSLKERFQEWRRRRTGRNAWTHHAIVDEFAPTESTTPTTPEQKI